MYLNSEVLVILATCIHTKADNCYTFLSGTTFTLHYGDKRVSV